MSIAGGFAQAALKTGQQFGCNAMQIFTKSPRGRIVKPVDPDDAAEFRKLCAQFKINYVIAHSSYLLNFGKPISAVQWALKDIMTDFERLASLGGQGVVVHIGKSLDGARDEAVKNVIENAKIVVDKTATVPRNLEYILENTAGQGSEIGFRLEELGQIWKGLHGFSPRLKSCLDTAHIWAAGYDISTAESVQKVLQEYDQLIGLKTLSCFHFNDSKKPLGSRVDRHENMGFGLIGSEKSLPQDKYNMSAFPVDPLEGLSEIAKFAEKNGIPLILETPDKDGRTHLDDIKMVKERLL